MSVYASLSIFSPGAQSETCERGRAERETIRSSRFRSALPLHSSERHRTTTHESGRAKSFGGITHWPAGQRRKEMDAINRVIQEPEDADEEQGTDPSVYIVMPAYNAASTLLDTHNSIPATFLRNVILVDDNSSDETIATARDIGVEVIAHLHNIGYGGNQKTCYLEALRQGADIVVMLHPDGQYDPLLIPEMIAPILKGEADMVLGSRFLRPGGPEAGDMPPYKIFANRFLTTVENYVLGTHFSELHTGYRAYSRKFLETVPFLRNANDFVFDSQIIAQAVAFGMRVVEIPVTTKYFPEASSVDLKQSLVYGFKTLGVMSRFRLHESGLLKAAIFLH